MVFGAQNLTTYLEVFSWATETEITFGFRAYSDAHTPMCVLNSFEQVLD